LFFCAIRPNTNFLQHLDVLAHGYNGRKSLSVKAFRNFKILVFITYIRKNQAVAGKYGDNKIPVRIGDGTFARLRDNDTRHGKTFLISTHDNPRKHYGLTLSLTHN